MTSLPRSKIVPAALTALRKTNVTTAWRMNCAMTSWLWNYFMIRHAMNYEGSNMFLIRAKN